MFLKCAILRHFSPRQIVTYTGNTCRDLKIVRDGSCVVWHNKSSRDFERIRCAFDRAFRRRDAGAHEDVELARNRFTFASTKQLKDGVVVASIHAGSFVGSEFRKTRANVDDEHGRFVVSASGHDTRGFGAEIWYLPSNLVDDRFLGARGTIQRLRRFVDAQRARHTESVRQKMLRHDAPIIGRSQSYEDLSKMRKVHSSSTRRDGRALLTKAIDAARVRHAQKTIPSLREQERNEPTDATQALLLLELQSHEMAKRAVRRMGSESSGMRGTFRTSRPLAFAAPNTGRLLLHNMQRLLRESERDVGRNRLPPLDRSPDTKRAVNDVPRNLPARAPMRTMREATKRITIDSNDEVKEKRLYDPYPASVRRATLAEMWAKASALRNETGGTNKKSKKRPCTYVRILKRSQSHESGALDVDRAHLATYGADGVRKRLGI